MKTALIALASVMCFGLSAQAFAQTCASPLPISSGGTPNGTVSGDLCTATNSLPTYGGITSPQKEMIYSFVAQGANATIAYTANGYTGVVYLMPSPCAPSTDPTGIGTSTGTNMTVSGLTNGATYYVIFTANPGGPEDACGTFTGTVTGTLPVSLQNFSVE